MKKYLSQHFFVFVLIFIPIFVFCDEREDIRKYVSSLKSSDAKVRLAAIESLSRIQNNPEVVDILVDAFKQEQDNYLKIQILEVLAIQKSTKSLECIYSALDDTNPYVRQQAVISLGYYTDEEKVANILSDIFDKEEKEFVKLTIVNTVGNMTNRVAIPVLSKALNEKNSKQLRFLAIERLHKIGNTEALVELEKYKNDKDLEIKQRINKIISEKRKKIEIKKK